jgi:hypothetical protein
MTDVDPFDDALTRMHNAMRAAHDAFLDADAALTLGLQAMRDATAARGSLGDQITEMRDTIQQLQQIVMQQSVDIRELRQRDGGADKHDSEVERWRDDDK